MDQNNLDRRKHIPWIFLPSIIAYGIQFALLFIAIQVYLVYSFATYKSEDYFDLMTNIIQDFLKGGIVAWVQVAYAVVTIIISIFIFKNFYREGRFQTLSGKLANPGFTVLGIVLFSVGMQYVTVYLMNALGSSFPEWMEEYETLIENSGLGSEMTLPLLLYAIVLGPICEELLYRGITFFAAKKVMHVYLAILVQAAMFGLFHMNKIQGIYAFVLGVGLGYVMYLYDSLILTIVIHVLFNIIGTLGSEVLPTGGDNIVSFFICTLAALVVTYISILFLRKGAVSVNNDPDSADI